MERTLSNGRPWTPDEDARLLNMRAEGKTFGQIARVINRSTASCEARHTKITGRQRKPRAAASQIDHDRPCLVCHLMFRPTHTGEYIHEKCRVTDYSPYEVSVGSPMGPAKRIRPAA